MALQSSLSYNFIVWINLAVARTHDLPHSRRTLYLTFSFTTVSRNASKIIHEEKELGGRGVRVWSTSEFATPLQLGRGRCFSFDGVLWFFFITCGNKYFIPLLLQLHVSSIALFTVPFHCHLTNAIFFPASSVVDRGFEPRSGQAKDYEKTH
jgi:hypothetical protein